MREKYRCLKSKYDTRNENVDLGSVSSNAKSDVYRRVIRATYVFFLVIDQIL